MGEFDFNSRADLRFRMIRSYNDRGEWVSLTLIQERKISC